MKSKIFVACFLLFSGLSYGQSKSKLLPKWVEYLKSTISTKETPVEIAEILFYTVDTSLAFTHEIAGPSIPNPVTINDVDKSTNLVTMMVSNDRLVSYKREDVKKTNAKKSDKRESASQKRESSDVLSQVDKILLNPSKGEMTLSGVNITIKLQDKGEQCIGKFSLDGIDYKVELKMLKAKLDQKGNLIFI